MEESSLFWNLVQVAFYCCDVYTRDVNLQRGRAPGALSGCCSVPGGGTMPGQYLVAEQVTCLIVARTQGDQVEGGWVLISLSRTHPQWPHFLPLGATS